MAALLASITGFSEPEQKQDWDPFCFPSRQPSALCIRRVQRDIRQVQRDPLPNCFVCPDDSQSTVVHCLLTGNADTPYEGGMFYFFVACPDDYPASPPRVKILTGLGRCQFNPNLYSNGKVCLSILNTWSGPSWSPANTLASVLLSIQSLMNDKPYHNEPGFEVEHYRGDVQAYNDIVQHEKLRHGVLGMMADLREGRLPKGFAQTMEAVFLTMFEGYKSSCQERKHRDGEVFRDPFGCNVGHFQYGAMLEELSSVYAGLQAGASAGA